MYVIDKISNNQINISVIKGNTFKGNIQIIDDARLAYKPCAGDLVIFSVFNKYTDSTPIYEKKIPYDTLMLEFSAKETERMKINDYVYRIRLIKQNGEVDDFLHGKFSVKGMIE